MPSTDPDSSASRGPHRASPSLRRREFVAGAAGVAALGAAGCLILDSSEESGSSATGDWPTYRGDHERSGLAPAEAGPGESLSVAWETSIFDVIEEREGVSARSYGEVEDDYEGYVASGMCGGVTLTDDVVLGSMVYWLYEGQEEEAVWAGIVAMDPDDGSIEWTIAGVSGQIQSPTVVGDRLYHFVLYPYGADADGSHVLVADAETGDVEARHPVPGSRRYAPTITADAIYHRAPSGADGDLVAIDPDSGDRDWIADAPDPIAELHPFTIADESIVYASPLDQDTQAIVALDRETGDEQWRREVDQPVRRPGAGPEYLGTPSVVDGHGFVAGRWREFHSNEVGGTALRSFELEGGDERWTFRPDGVPYEEIQSGYVPPIGCGTPEDCEPPEDHAAIYGTPLVVDDLVVAPGFGEPAPGGFEHDLHRHVYAISASDGSLQWSIPGAAASAVAAGDVIYVRSAEDAVRAVSTDGTVLDRVGTDAGPSWGRAPAIGHGRVYTSWGTNEGRGAGRPDTIVAIE